MEQARAKKVTEHRVAAKIRKFRPGWADIAVFPVAEPVPENA